MTNFRAAACVKYLVDKGIDSRRLESDGFRDHSATRQSQVNARVGIQQNAQTRWTVLFNYADSPLAEAPVNLYIADTGKDIVQRMIIQDNGGEPLNAIALDGIQSGTAFVVPTDFVSDDVQFQYITDLGNRRVLRYNPEDLYIQKVNVELDRFGDSLHVPVAVTADDSLVYVADRETGRITWYQRRK